MAAEDKRSPPEVSVVMPVHNEGRATAEVCAKIREALEPMGDGAFEVLIVDDASTDGALKECPEAADRVLRHRRNRGYGAAIKTGFRHARGKTLVIIDGDGTYDPADIPRLLDALTHARGMAVGARVGADAAKGAQRRKAVQIPLIRRPAKWVLNTLANYLAGQRIPDLNSGLRAVRSDRFDRYLHLLPEGFSLTTTLTLAFLCDGREIAYIPIDYGARHEGKSKIRPFRDTRQILITILRTVTYFNPLKVFLPLSAALGCAAVGVLIASAWSGQVMDGTVAVLTLTSVQSIAFGLLADAIARTGKYHRRD